MSSSFSDNPAAAGLLPDGAFAKLFADLFVEGRMGLALLSPEGCIAEADIAWCHLFGYSRDEMCGLPAAQLCHPDFADFLPGQIASPEAGNRVVSVELQLRTKSGGTFWGRLLSRAATVGQPIPLLLEDISARKQREVSLTKAMQKLQVIADRIPAMLSYVNSELRYQFVNEAYESFYKCSKEEIIGRRIQEVVAPEVWTVAAPYFARALAGEHVSYEGLFASADPALQHSLVSLVPDKAPNADVRGIFILVTNITELKKTEARLQDAIAGLRASEVNLKALMEAAPDSLFVVDKDDAGRILYCNARVYEMFGYRAEELLGQSVEMLFPPEKRTLYAEYRQQYRQNPQAWASRRPRDLYALHKSGRQVPIDIGLNPTKFDGKDVTMATVRDVSGIYAAFESSVQIADIVEASGDAIFRSTLDGRILYWSKGAEKLYGWRADEMIGQMVHRMIPDFDLERSKNEIRGVLDRNEIVMRPDTVRLHKDGSLIEVSVAVFPIRDAEGNVIGGASVHRDVRELKRLEAQLRHAQRLDAAGLLAGGVAHDFNNILTVIQGYCSLITEAQPPDSLLTRQVHAIESAAQRASSLTRQLLAFSQKQRRDVKILDPRALLSDLAPILQRAIGEDIRLETDLASSWNIQEDPADFEQIILNLAVNARHAMPKGGMLRIASSNVESSGFGFPSAAASFSPIPVQPGAYVLLEITDTGVGIAPDVLTRIFEPFFTTKSRGEGSGLGLPVVYGIVKNIGGGIVVTSREGAGTRFQIYLPRSQERPEADRNSGDNAGGPPGKGSVLVVEDSPEILNLVKMVLQGAGYTVLPAASGPQALARQGEQVDLVLTDVVMPGMNGPEFAERWLKVHPKTPVLYMTGYAEESVLPFSVNPDNLLLKPFKPAQLLQKAAAVLGRVQQTS
ncbi:MAG: PAS domain S-box protein [Pseudomonadota bacterium]|nr:PAS domain S-box protein [Pseudomonadota bacterium]